MADLRKHSSTSNLIRFTLKNSSTGQGLTGLSSASSGLIIATICDNEATATVYTVAASNVETITTLGTYSAPTASKCRFKEVDATNHKGLYEFQFADARFSVASAKRLVISVSGATSLLDADYEIQLVSFDIYTAIAQTGDGYAIVNNGTYGNAQLTRTSALPANFSVMSISATTGLVDITQAAADKAWGSATRILTAGTNIALAKGTGVTGFNDIAAADVWAVATRTITGGTITTNNDKTGYSLTQAFPTNFSLLSIDGSGYVTEVNVDGIKKNTALNNFEFLMVDATDGYTEETGLTVTAQRSIDGAVFGACANAVTELSNGIYKINLAAADLNGDVITLRFSATGARSRLITLKTNI